MNLLETIMGQLGPGTVGKLSGLLGESEGSTKKALGAAVPALMGQVAGKASTEKGASELFDMIGDNDGSQDFSSMLDNKDALMNSGSGMLSGLMGSQSSGLSSMLSKFTGVGGNSMTSLMGMIAPLIMGTLGKAKSTMGLDASGMAGLLSDQSESFKAALPSGLADQMGSFGLGNVGGSIKGAAGNLAGGVKGAATNVADGVKGAAGNVASGAGNMVGKTVDGVKGAGGAVGGAVGDVGRGAANVAGDVADAGGGLMRKLGPLLGLLVALALALFGWKMCGSDVKDVANKAADTTKNVADKAADASKNAASKTLDATKNAAGAVGDAAGKAADATKDAAGKAVEGVKDAGKAAANTVKKGAEALGFAANSAEARFADLLSSGKGKVGDKIELRGVKFVTGSANLDRSSNVQLNNLVKIMESYPNLKVKLEGHTDNTGDKAKNITLSKARATACLNYVTSKGIAKNRLQADGVGDAKPVAKNDTSDGRKQNRRVEASILSL